MKLRINFVSLSLLILVFTFQSQHTVGQSGGNGAKSKLVSEDNPSLKAESVLESHETLDKRSPKEDKAVNEENRDDTPKRSIEKEHADDEDGSYSSSSSSSEESGRFPPSTIGTTSKPHSNGSSAVLGKKIKLMKMDTTRLIKPRDPRNSRKGENWYAVKRSANAQASASIRGGGGGGVGHGGNAKQKQSQQQRLRQSGRTVGGVAEGMDNDGGGTSAPGLTKASEQPGLNKQGPTGLLGGGKGGKDPFGNNNYAGGQKGGEGVLINKTAKKPFNVERVNRPVDPSVYSFFQYKPSESIGFLWTQSAGLGGSGPGSGMAGRLDLIGNDRGTEDDDLDPSNKLDWESRRYDRACLYVEYTVNKAQMNSTQVTEEVSRMVDGQNEQLARRFLDWQFINKEDHETIALKGEGEKHPLYLTYKFMTMTMEIFRDKICRNATPYATTPEVKPFGPVGAASKAEANKKYLDTKLLPKSFIDDLYRLFLTLRDITLPKGVPDYPTKKDEEDIYTEVLENCLKLDPIQWYSHTCADQVLSYDDPRNYACTPLIDDDFNYKEYDPILDGMWHMFTAVHAFCFEEFNKRNTRLWHKYAMILVNSYTVGMRTRWKASIAEPKFYSRLLGPDHTTHLETMNRCMFAATLRSSAPAVLPRFLSVSPITFQKERTIGKDGSEAQPKG